MPEAREQRTYPAHIICPSCGAIAANMTIGFAELLKRKLERRRIDRHVLRSDLGKPGPSHHLVVCQHCHYSFRSNESKIVDKARTV